jgi:hypothetical protein
VEEAAEQQRRRCALTSRGYEGVAGVSKMCVNKSMYEYSNARVKHQVPSKPPAPLSTSSKWSAHTAPRIQRSPTPHASPATARRPSSCSMLPLHVKATLVYLKPELLYQLDRSRRTARRLAGQARPATLTETRQELKNTLKKNTLTDA